MLASPETMQMPQITWYKPSPPPLTKEGKKLFRGELFHIIPNEKEKETIGQGSLDLYERLKTFIIERAGGSVVSIEQAQYILIRHSSITEYARTIEDPIIAKKLLHFDWVLDSLCSKEKQSRNQYWGIPRNQVDISTKKNENLPKDPRRIISSTSVSSSSS
ncbi:uncharacterized protein I206_106282 [Kwoniella pini CBS 10737]|uniref:BRCT domain-containing protein n=1 Tax=Kwoniella pini CBS 10737 TaxID=1296096 RepID=A0A1B9I1N3_9TREE|nr:uncharacterized protein I206_05108 [Kwoniella pini CBS 10737]OCF49415.1 hypothetical protein I206_05108 [Kwoniella pini CBS 10737]